MAYLNNAATTWPKPAAVYEAVDCTFREGNSPLRTAGARATATNLLSDARSSVASFFNIKDSSRLAFTPGCTYSLNAVIRGLPWEKGDSIIISGLEHNAVSRPARRIAKEFGVDLRVLSASIDNPLQLDELERLLAENKVRLVCCMMASNVTGSILPYEEVVRFAQANGAMCLLDGAQTAGVYPIDIGTLNPDFFAFAGHKGLFGPQGVGGLYIIDGVQLAPLVEGGTGGNSGKHKMPTAMPAAHESGTHNLPAIAGLKAGVEFVSQTGIETIHHHETKLKQQFLAGVEAIQGLALLSDSEGTSVVLLNLEGVGSAILADYLADEHGLITRAGFHCAPMAHEAVGTNPGLGAVRVSFGYFNTEAEVEVAIQAIKSAAITLK